MVVATGLLSFVEGILSELGSLSVPYIQFVFCFSCEKRRLMNTLSTIRAVLLDAEKKQQENSHTDEDWLEKLQVILYDAEDLVEDLSLEVQQPVDVNRNMANKVLNFFSTIRFYIVMAFKMKMISGRLNDVAADKNKFRPVQQVVGLPDKNKETKETHAFVPANKVIGREGDKRAIKELLKKPSNEENVSIIPIIGIGGLGKTTLAQLEYNDEEEDRIYFDLKMWVWVSTVFDVKTLIEKVIKAATKKECPNLEMDQLQSLLRENLDGKKYLLVLDDVWNTNRERWVELENLLMGGARGSMILVTTRDREVARIMGNIGSSHELRGLSKDDSRSLFKQVAFGQMEENPGLLAVGEEILKKCGGIPLAIRTVAGLLFVMDTETEWLNVKNQLWKLAEEDNDILPTLRVSYERLPSHLKKCFAYCSLFLKGSKIDRATLIQLWMAQGSLIQPSENRLLEDIGDEYFKILWKRSFFQDEEMDDCGNVISCKMHDLMHDLAQTVAGREYSIVNDDAVTIPERVIHASVNLSYGKEIPTSLVNARRLRTLLMLRASRIKDFDKLASTFKCLRVLSMRVHTRYLRSPDIDIEKLNSMGELKSLRYLDLSGSGIETLPDSVCELQNLQTLKLGWLELPRDTKKLVRLRHLDLSFGRIELLPNSVCELQNLQTLNLNYCQRLRELPRDIKKLVSLRHLDLSFTRIELLPNSVCELQNLQTLKLNFCESLRELPRDIKKLVNLRHLENSVCSKLKGMPSGFGQLTSIQTLPLFVLGSGGLSDLEGLNNLRGQLKITDLVKARNATSESREKKYLKEKKYLQTLTLSWYADEDSEDEDAATFEGLQPNPNGDEDAALLGSLQPNPNLKGLCIDRYGGVRFPSWMVNMGNSLPHLVEISLASCPSCECFPLFAQLRFLKVLKLEFLKSLDYIRSYIGDSSSSFKSNVLSGAGEWFPALKEVYLRHLPKLKEWSREVVVVNDGGKAKTEAVAEQRIQLLSLNSLSTLTIEHCPELKSMPLHPDVEELTLVNVSGALVQSMTVTLSKLKQLSINSCGSLVTLLEWTGNITSIQSLSICRCEKLTSLPRGMQHLTALEKLEILDCPELNFSDEDNDMPGLQSLHLLKLSGLPKLVSLPKVLQHSTALKYLEIKDCPGLMTLPDWFGNLLWSLTIRRCEKLTSLPRGMQHLTALEKLEILDCPELNFSDEDNDMPGLQSLHLLKLSGLPKLVSLPKVLQHSTALKYLEIKDCPGLMTLPDWFGNLLRSLTIRRCEKLTSLPRGMQHLTALENLEILDCPELNFSDEDNDMSGLQSLHSLKLSKLPKLVSLPKVLQHSTALKYLEIKQCPGLMTLPDWFGNLLRSLTIRRCEKLTSLPRGMQHLTALEKLEILDCPELNFSDEDNDMSGLQSLHSLKLSKLPKLVSLPKVLQHSTALKCLEIKDFPGLMILPDWFGNLTSLRKITISDCNELKSLPEGMRCFTALQELIIWKCPYLSETCRKETGEDWPKIAHIPNIYIDCKEPKFSF